MENKPKQSLIIRQHTDDVPRSSEKRKIIDDQRIISWYLSKHPKASFVIGFMMEK